MPRILIVEDNEGLAKTWQELCQNMGWEVEIALNENRAIGVIRDFPPFDVSVVDMCLSPGDKKGEGGLRTIERISKKDPGTQIIAVSTYMDLEDVLNTVYKALAYNIYRFIDKKRIDLEKVLFNNIGTAIEYANLKRSGKIVTKTLPAYAFSSRRNEELSQGLVEYGIWTEAQVARIKRDAAQAEMGLEAYLRYKDSVMGRDREKLRGLVTWVLRRRFGEDDVDKISLYSPDILKEERKGLLIRFLKLCGVFPVGLEEERLIVKMANEQRTIKETVDQLARAIGNKRVIKVTSSPEEIEKLFAEIE
ncbi:MAG: response regulator [bacterium]